MIEILNFVFSGFWTWIGSLILVIAAGNAFAGFIRLIFTNLLWKQTAPKMQELMTNAIRAAMKDAK